MPEREIRSADYERRAESLLDRKVRFDEAVVNLQFTGLRLDVVQDQLNYDIDRGLQRRSDAGLKHAEVQLHMAICEVVDQFREQIGRNVRSLAALGGWQESLGTSWIMHRIPSMGAVPSQGEPALGWNPVMSVAMGYVSGDEAKQLCVTLIDPSCYAEPVVRLVQREICGDVTNLEPDSATAQWLACRDVESRERVNLLEFIEQAAKAESFAFNSDLRIAAAISAFDKLGKMFSAHSELPPDIPFGAEIGCIEAAYVHGHPLAVRKAQGDYFLIETFQHRGLGLEDFSWRALSAEAAVCNGPVAGDGRRVVCADFSELKAALKHCRRRFAGELRLIAKD